MKNILLRDLHLSYATLMLFALLVMLFAFGIPAEMLASIAPPLVCVCLLISSVLALPNLFAQDDADGLLEQYVVQPLALPWLVAVKLAAHWMSCLLPMLIFTPLALSSMQAQADAWHVTVTLGLASVVIVAIGGIVAALTLAVQSALLPMLIALPLYVPALIFSTQLAMDASRNDAWLWLGAMALVAVPVSCWVSGAVIRLSQD